MLTMDFTGFYGYKKRKRKLIKKVERAHKREN
jgi:hypothetical protein